MRDFNTFRLDVYYGPNGKGSQSRLVTRAARVSERYGGDTSHKSIQVRVVIAGATIAMVQWWAIETMNATPTQHRLLTRAARESKPAMR